MWAIEAWEPIDADGIVPVMCRVTCREAPIAHRHAEFDETGCSRGFRAGIRAFSHSVRALRGSIGFWRMGCSESLGFSGGLRFTQFFSDSQWKNGYGLTESCG